MSIKKEQANKTSLGMKCGDCIHFRCNPGHPIYGKRCSDLGIKSYASAPNCFTPDVVQLAQFSSNIINSLGMLMRDMNTAQLRILTHTIKTCASLHKVNLKFGQPVYVCLGEEYLSHYFKAYVINLTGDGEFVQLSASLTKGRKSTFITVPPKSVYTLPQFKIKRDALVKSGRLYLEVDVKTLPMRKIPISDLVLLKKMPQVDRVAKGAEYTPPTLDSAPHEWLDSRINKKLVNSRKKLKVTTSKSGAKSVSISRK